MTRELRDDSPTGAGWEVVLRVDGEIVLGHRSDTGSRAMLAHVFRRDISAPDGRSFRRHSSVASGGRAEDVHMRTVTATSRRHAKGRG